MVAPVFLMILVGVIIRGSNLIDKITTTYLPKIVIYVLYPCLLLRTILSSNSLENPKNLLLAPVAGFLCISIGIALSYFLLKKGFKQETPHRAFAFTTGIFNYGYIPLPLCLGLFGENTLAVLMAFSVGVELAIWTVGILFLTGHAEGKWWKHILNPPLITLLIAIPIVMTGTTHIIPIPVYNTVSSIADSAIPIGLIAIGANLFDLGKSVFQNIRIKPCIWSILIRCGILPVLFISVAIFVPLTLEIQQVLIIQAAMPCGIFPIVICRHFSSDSSLSFQIVLATTIIGVITVPAWLHLGLNLISTIAKL